MEILSKKVLMKENVSTFSLLVQGHSALVNFDQLVNIHE